MNTKRLIITAILPLAFLLTSCGETKGAKAEVDPNNSVKVEHTDTKINPNDYVKIEYTGYSNDATATFSLDANKMVTDYPEAFRLGRDYKQSDLDGVVNQINQTTLGQLSKTEGISNGDEITFSWDEAALSDLEDYYKIQWEGDQEYKETAADIPELIEFNPFDGFEPSFVGESPHLRTNGDYVPIGDVEEIFGYTPIKIDGHDVRGYIFGIYYLPYGAEYASGDKITTKVYFHGIAKDNYDVVELARKRYGILLTQTEKEYIVP